jgi:ketosteroid isomerase-like protein
MTGSSDIEGLVRGLCAARVAGDMDVLRRGYAENATFRIVGSPAWGTLTAPLVGHAAIMARFEAMIAGIALSDFAILNLFVDGNLAAVRWRATVRDQEAKEESTTEVAQFLEVENGKVVSLVEFLDTAYALSQLGKAPAAQAAKTEDRS